MSKVKTFFVQLSLGVPSLDFRGDDSYRTRKTIFSAICFILLIVAGIALASTSLTPLQAATIRIELALSAAGLAASAIAFSFRQPIENGFVKFLLLLFIGAVSFVFYAVGAALTGKVPDSLFEVEIIKVPEVNRQREFNPGNSVAPSHPRDKDDDIVASNGGIRVSVDDIKKALADIDQDIGIINVDIDVIATWHTTMNKVLMAFESLHVQEVACSTVKTDLAKMTKEAVVSREWLERGRQRVIECETQGVRVRSHLESIKVELLQIRTEVDRVAELSRLLGKDRDELRSRKRLLEKTLKLVADHIDRQASDAARLPGG